MDTGTTASDKPVPKGDTGSAGSSRLDRLQHEAAVWWRWLRRRATVGIQSLGRSIDHGEVITEVEADGQLSGRYVFMVVMSCAIAILGLLLSSPAVVIGAMLISPLMGPIMLMGFSLCVLDYGAMRKALISMGAGIAGALAIAILIVMFSPLREATPEILARTRPNLFDLLVAIFSGLAGGYSVIHRKGATIVGVAIATALMPPLAVVGFGIATGSAVIAGGAFFLFMTNLLAIALSVTGLAWLYGFGTVHSEKTAPWQTALVLVVFAGLSLPLGFALREIAYEARVQNVVRYDALRPFAGRDAEVSGLTVTFPRNQPSQISQTVITREQVADAEEQLQRHYETTLGARVEVSLNQILIDEGKPIDADEVLRVAQRSMAPLQQQIADMAKQDRSADAIRTAISFRTLAIEISPAARTAVIVAAPNPTLNAAAFRDMETSLTARFPDWRLSITPPPQAALPVIAFNEGGDEVSQQGLAALDAAVWALQRWQIANVVVEGNASLGGSTASNRALALRRAEAVAARLQAKGIKAEARSGYPVPGQAAIEREFGKARFTSATISPAG
jgi:uncharacterized hydrophobic protein (TIGR00271 family)